MIRNSGLVTIFCFVLAVAVDNPGRAQATPSTAAKTMELPVKLNSGAVYPSMRPAVSIEVFLNGGPRPNYALIDEVRSAEARGWKCSSPASYAVTAQGSTKRLPIAAVMPVGSDPCDKRPIPAPVLLLLNVDVDSGTNYVVTLAGLPSGKTIASRPAAFAGTTTSALSLVPQAAPGETLTNGKKRDVGQLAVSYSIPFVAHSPVFVKTKDLFSTDERDAKCAFEATVGVSHGLLRTWYTPVQLNETLQGNQVATSLSAVTNLSASALAPWYWTRSALNNRWIDAGLAPEFALAGQYTHRITQEVTAKTKKLADNDASFNPSLVIEPFYLFPDACNRYRKWMGAKADDRTSRQFCLGYQVNLGLWYLPLDKTKAGSQQAEGYGDVSILIPLSNLNFKNLALVEKDGLLNSQIHIRYSDSVNPANNYARTRAWSFGIEVMK